jgi:hypothetical protein
MNELPKQLVRMRMPITTDQRFRSLRAHNSRRVTRRITTELGRIGSRRRYYAPPLWRHEPLRWDARSELARGRWSALRRLADSWSSSGVHVSPLHTDNHPYQDHLLGESEWCLCAIINRPDGKILNACSDVSGLAWTPGEIGICPWTAKIPVGPFRGPVVSASARPLSLRLRGRASGTPALGLSPRTDRELKTRSAEERERETRRVNDHQGQDLSGEWAGTVRARGVGLPRPLSRGALPRTRRRAPGGWPRFPQAGGCSPLRRVLRHRA